MWKAYHFDRWSLNYIRLIHCRGTISPYEILFYSAVLLSYCKNKLSKYYYSRLKECFMKWLCSDFFLSFFFFVQKISFLLPVVLIAYFHYCVHAGQKSGDIRVIKVDGHQAATVQLVHKQKIPDVRKESLRFRPDDSSNPCLNTSVVILISQSVGVKSLVCRQTAVTGCKPINGKYLCEKVFKTFSHKYFPLTGYDHRFDWFLIRLCVWMSMRKTMIQVKITLYLSLFNLFKVLNYF